MIITLILAEQSYRAQSTVTDLDIKRIAEDGGTESLHDLYNKIYQSLYGYALSLTKNTHDAEDVLQETFISIHRSAGNYRPCGKPMAWIFTIAKNHARMKLRERNRADSLEEARIEDSDAFSHIGNSEARMVLQIALKALTDEERQIVTLHCVTGLKNREIAELMELPLNTVLSKYHRALKRMKEILKEEDFYA